MVRQSPLLLVVSGTVEGVVMELNDPGSHQVEFDHRHKQNFF